MVSADSSTAVKVSARRSMAPPDDRLGLRWAYPIRPGPNRPSEIRSSARPTRTAPPPRRGCRAVEHIAQGLPDDAGKLGAQCRVVEGHGLAVHAGGSLGGGVAVEQ